MSPSCRFRSTATSDWRCTLTPTSTFGSTAPAVEPNELVGVRVHLQSAVSVDRHRHKGDLQLVAAPGHGAVVRVLERLGLQVERLGTGTDVCDAHGLTLALESSTVMTPTC